MQWHPRPHQQLIVDHVLDTPRCNLWADMGAGKTAAVLTALELLWLAGSTAHPALVVAPKRVARDVWPAEVAKWDHLRHLRVVVLDGTARQKSARLSQPCDLYTASYDSLPGLRKLLPGGHGPWRCVIADESRKLRGLRATGGAVRAWALRQITRQAIRWVNMTGTPAPEGLLDLWGPQYLLDGGDSLRPTYTEYQARYFHRPVKHRPLRALPGAQEVIQHRLEATTLSMHTRDWLEGMYESCRVTVPVTLPPSARELYRRMEQRFIAELDSGATLVASNAGVLQQRCWQIANGAVYTDDGLEEGGVVLPPERRAWERVHDAKLQALSELVSALDGKPLLVVYHFRTDRWRLEEAFRDLVVYETADHARAWNAGEIAMMALHPGRGGHGLSLQDGGCHMVFFSQTPSLELRLQVIERIGPARQILAGHPRPVMIYDLIATDTVDEMMHYRIREKASAQDALRHYLSSRRR